VAHRFHIVQEFNKGIYDYIIATDEGGGKVDVDSCDEKKDENLGSGSEAAEHCEHPTLVFFWSLASNRASLGIVAATQRTFDPPGSEVGLSQSPASRKRKRASSPKPKTEPKTELTSTTSKKRKKRAPGARDREYGVSRGIDFVDVACVINFDLPASAKSYTHRVGRTARAGRSGVALSLIVPREEHGKNRVLSFPGAVRDEEVFTRIEREQAARGSKIQDWKFEKGQVDGFRYRMEDALRAVTASTIKEARIRELKQEVLASNKLKVSLCVAQGTSGTNYLLRPGPL
jgi:ATP-dependent RNA helicase DDX56/DBP9